MSTRAFEVGAVVGPFAIRGLLGRGGMGEVWRAEDGRLGREVALKLLPADFAGDPDRHQRFEREARLLASLNHPNIATLYGLEHLDGQHVLVMELVEGEGLDQLLARGPLPLSEVIGLARQIADALEAAHEAGIIHRDLKPANVRVRPDGTVKVLDFGLAKAWSAGEGDSDPTVSPTLTHRATADGVILGTAAYMAPEQARGKRIDRRADVWAFGVVLFEMLTGRQLFRGETVTDVLAAVLTVEPDLDALPPHTPIPVRRLLARCLERDLRRRLQWIGDARLELLDAESATGDPPPPAPAASPRRRSLILPVVAAALAVTLLLLSAALVFHDAEPPTPRPIRTDLMPPKGGSFHLGLVNPGPPVLSPDGTRVAFAVLEEGGRVRLWIRDLADTEARPLPGTDGAQYPFWSPDGRSLGYVDRDDRHLCRIDLADGAIRRICPSRNGKGGAWNRDGVIVFTPDATDPLFRVSAEGGDPVQLTILGEGFNSHRHPEFLPDGNRFLYLARSATDRRRREIRIGSLDGSVDGVLLESPAAALPVGRYLFLVDSTSLVVRPFDPDGLTVGEPAARLVPDITLLSGAARAVFTASEDLVVSLSGRVFSLRQLRWRGLDGSDLGAVGEPESMLSASISPDGTVAAVPSGDEVAGTQDLWLIDVATGLRTRITSAPGEDIGPVWAPDGRTLYFSSERTGRYRPYRYLLDTGAVEPVGDWNLMVYSVSPDGRWLAAATDDDSVDSDIAVVPADGGGEPRWILDGPFIQDSPAISPDGRWLAFVSDESGDTEIYLTTFPEPGRRWRVSPAGGRLPQWVGRERLAWIEAESSLVTAPVDLSGRAPKVGTPWTVVRSTNPDTRWPGYGAPAAGDRLLVLEAAAEEQHFAYTVLSGWKGLLEHAD